MLQGIVLLYLLPETDNRSFIWLQLSQKDNPNLLILSLVWRHHVNFVVIVLKLLRLLWNVLPSIWQALICPVDVVCCKIVVVGNRNYSIKGLSTPNAL